MIDHHCDYYDKTSEHYIIWLIDYGYAVHGTDMSIRPLHPSFCARKLSEPVLKVGVAHVLPVSEEYDYLNECSYQEKSDNWDAFTVRKFKELLENASCIKFKTEYCANGHYFGEVLIQDKRGQFEDAAEILVQIGRAVDTLKTTVFMDELKKIETLNFERYQDNDRRTIRPVTKQVQHQSRQRNDFITHRAKRMLHHITNVKVIECFDDTPVNDIPKNIPAEMHPSNKVARWLEKYVELPKVKRDDVVDDGIDDETAAMPLLVARKSFNLKHEPRIPAPKPAPLRKFSTHNVIRPPKILLDETDHKSEINISTCVVTKETSVAAFSVKSIFVANLLERLAKKQAARKEAAKLESVSGTVAPSIVETKRTMDIIPADYEQIRSQQERSRFKKHQTDTTSVYTSRTFTTCTTKQRQNGPATNFKNNLKTRPSVQKEEDEELW